MSSRRQFLAQLSATTVAAAALKPVVTETPLSVGLEIYSLRREMAKDIPGTLARIRTMGFTHVEVPGFYGLTPEAFRKALDTAGLKATAMVAQWDDLNDMGKVTAHLAILGAQWAILPWIPHGATFTRSDADIACRNMNAWGPALAKAGYRFAYHPHGYEFRPALPTLPEDTEPPEGMMLFIGPLPGSPRREGTLFDVLVRQTDAATVHFEMDTFWVVWPGENCVRLLHRYGKRFRLLHLKDLSRAAGRGDLTGSAPDEDSVAIGDGGIPWAAVLTAARHAGIEHYYLEDESPNAASQIPRSLHYLSGLEHQLSRAMKKAAPSSEDAASVGLMFKNRTTSPSRLPQTPSTCGSAKDDAACAAPWLRSAGCVRA